MSIASITCDIVNGLKLCCSPVINHFHHLSSLKSTAKSLEEEANELRRIKADVENEVRMLEMQRPRVKCKNQVSGWIQSVEELSDEEEKFQESLRNKSTRLSGCNCLPKYKHTRELTKIADELLKQAVTLKSTKESLGGLVGEVPPDPIELVPAKPPDSIVGQKEMLSKIREHLEDDGVGVVGIYGMGGVGKTTLLKKVHNELVGKEIRFDLVIWLTISRDWSVLEIQERVAKRLCMVFSANGSYKSEENATILYSALSKKRFLLLLDDVWEKLELEKIGIPYPDKQNKCKIVFTTRSEDVCNSFDAEKKVRVPLLSESQSWELFCAKLQNRDILKDPSIEPFILRVAEKCDQLPLTLITVGRAMAKATTVSEWRKAAKDLSDSPRDFQGMEKEVFRILKFSFDRLENDRLRSCLLYCSLFPEDHEISKNQIITLWMGEGLLNKDGKDENDSDVIFDEGNAVIGSLRAACLLESCEEDHRKMRIHDSVRGMALWLTDGLFDKSNKFISYASKGLAEVPFGVETWKQSKRISLSYNEIKELPRNVPHCLNLRTLLLGGNEGIKEIPANFFPSFPVLRVLDLSCTDIDEVPASICSLVRLQYLNLSGTRIKSLPNELGELKRLRVLDLNCTVYLHRIPTIAISTLSSLLMLALISSGYEWKWNCNNHNEGGDGGGDGSKNQAEEDRQLSAKDLECLPQLDDIGIVVTSCDFLKEICSSDLLSKSIRSLQLQNVSGLTIAHLTMIFQNMKKLRALEIERCDQLEGVLTIDANSLHQPLKLLTLEDLPLLSGINVFEQQQRLSLCYIQISSCSSLKSLVGLGQLFCLESLVLEKCYGIEELVPDGRRGEMVNEEDKNFPNLKRIFLQDLQSLKSIAMHPLLLPSIEELCVFECPLLKKLPFGQHSAKKIREINGEQEWWDRLEWEDDRIKSDLFPYFYPVG